MLRRYLMNGVCVMVFVAHRVCGWGGWKFGVSKTPQQNAVWKVRARSCCRIFKQEKNEECQNYSHHGSADAIGLTRDAGMRYLGAT